MRDHSVLNYQRKTFHSELFISEWQQGAFFKEISWAFQILVVPVHSQPRRNSPYLGSAQGPCWRCQTARRQQGQYWRARYIWQWPERDGDKKLLGSSSHHKAWICSVFLQFVTKPVEASRVQSGANCDPTCKLSPNICQFSWNVILC